MFQGQQYQLIQYGQVIDSGSLMIQGNNLAMKSSVTGMVQQYVFQLQGGDLYLQDAYGQFYQFSRSSQQGGMGAPGQGSGYDYQGQQGGMGYQGQGGGGGNTAEIMRTLAGSWKDIRSTGNTIITLNQNGTFSYYSDYASGGDFSNQYGDVTGNWGYGNQGGMQGRWTAQGTPQRGTIYYQSQNGEQGTLDYQVMVEKGQVFWNEIYFDGTLYSRQ